MVERSCTFYNDVKVLALSIFPHILIRTYTIQVTEVEAELQKVGTNGEADVILVAEGGKDGCVSIEKVIEVAE